MEIAASILARHFKHVVVRAYYSNYTRVRFRADLVREEKIYFHKKNVPSQLTKWRETGGVFIDWRCEMRYGDHDAIVFSEAPRKVTWLDTAMQDTGMLGVIYQPPTWRLHRDTILLRLRDKHPRLIRRALDDLDRVEEMVNRLPAFSTQSLARLLRAREEESRTLPFHVSL